MISIVSPGFIGPMPPGVPVAITSPGRRVFKPGMRSEMRKAEEGESRRVFIRRAAIWTALFGLAGGTSEILAFQREKEGEKKLASGIIIPEAANKEKLFKGEVIAVGPGRRTDDGKRLAIEVKAGDTVYFKKPWDEPIKMNEVEYYVLSESDIILIEQ